MDEAGGQIQLLARNPRRKEMIGIVDWRVEELGRLGVPIPYHRYAEEDDVLSREPDLVVIATGGMPQNPPLAEGDDLVISGDGTEMIIRNLDKANFDATDFLT